MINLFFKLFFIFFRNKLPFYFKRFLIKNGDIILLTNFLIYFNLIYFLRKSTFFQIKNLVDLVIIDYPDKNFRFLITYFFLSINLNLRLRLTLCSKEIFSLLSTKVIFPSSN